MKRKTIAGLIVNLLMLAYLDIGVWVVARHSTFLGILYVVSICLFFLTVAYVWCARCPCRLDACTHLWLGKLMEWARTQPWWKDTAVIITSDHGEAFGDHGMWKHAFRLWDVLVKVPMLVYAPGIEPRRIKERRSLIDLAPTIMDLLGQPPLAQFVGESLVPELYGAPPQRRDVIVMELNADSHNPPQRAIVRGDYKLIVDGPNAGWKHALYNLAEDPGEKTDLAKREPEKLEEMKRIFVETFERIPSIAPYGGMKLKSGGTARGPMCPRPGKEAARDAGSR